MEGSVRHKGGHKTVCNLMPYFLSEFGIPIPVLTKTLTNHCTFNQIMTFRKKSMPVVDKKITIKYSFFFLLMAITKVYSEFDHQP